MADNESMESRSLAFGHDAMSQIRDMASPAKVAGTFLYALFCGVSTILLSAKDYEWMVGEPNADETKTTLCTIPAPMNDLSDVARLVTLVMVALLLACGLSHLIKRRRVNMSLVFALSLLGPWWYRFWGRTKEEVRRKIASVRDSPTDARLPEVYAVTFAILLCTYDDLPSFGSDLDMGQGVFILAT
jgi:hypothetical protein